MKAAAPVVEFLGELEAANGVVSERLESCSCSDCTTPSLSQRACASSSTSMAAAMPYHMPTSRQKVPLTEQQRLRVEQNLARAREIRSQREAAAAAASTTTAESSHPLSSSAATLENISLADPSPRQEDAVVPVSISTSSQESALPLSQEQLSRIAQNRNRAKVRREDARQKQLVQIPPHSQEMSQNPFVSSFSHRFPSAPSGRRNSSQEDSKAPGPPVAQFTTALQAPPTAPLQAPEEQTPGRDHLPRDFKKEMEEALQRMR